MTLFLNGSYIVWNVEYGKFIVGLVEKTQRCLNYKQYTKNTENGME